MEQLERLLMMILLVLFGGALSGGGLFQAMSWPVVLFALITIFLVRPIVGWISFIGVETAGDEKAVIAFFGIRGLGSAYYLAYGLGHAPFQEPHLLWSVIGFVVLISIVLHGATVTPIMRRLDRGRKRHAASIPQ